MQHVKEPTRERASPDYERPDENVALQRPPAVLSPNKARQGIALGEMRYVLGFGIALALLLMALAFVVAT